MTIIGMLAMTRPAIISFTGTRPVLDNRRHEGVAVTDGSDHLVPGLGEQPHQTLPQQDAVVCDDYPHGIRPMTRVGPPTGLSTVRVPSSPRALSTRPARP